MKKVICATVMLLDVFSFGADIDTIVKLTTALHVQDGSDHVYTIAPNTAPGSDGVYKLSYDILVKTQNLTLIPVDGDIVIDGGGSYGIALTNCWAGDHPAPVYNIGSSAHTITFKNGKMNSIGGYPGTLSVYVYQPAANGRDNLVVNLRNCILTNSVSGNGLDISGNSLGKFNCNITCTDCIIHTNPKDGVGVNTAEDLTIAAKTILQLVRCTIYNNDYDKSGAGDGDGATIHSANHFLDVSDCTFYSNGKTGVSSVGGHTYITNSTFYENGITVHTGGDVYVGGGSNGIAFQQLAVNGCTFYGLSKFRIPAHIMIGSYVNSVDVANSFFHSPVIGGEASAVIISDSTNMCHLSGNIFSGFAGAGSYVISFAKAETQAIIDHNTFYNCSHAIRIKGYSYRITNNIFSKINGIVINDDARLYGRLGSSGYNLFHACGIETMSRVTAHTDMKEEPQFKNAVSGNFSLRRTSPCVNVDKPTLFGGYKTIGAWEEIFDEDIAGSYGVDMIDFTDLAMYWEVNDCGDTNYCGMADIDGSGDVGLQDLVRLSSKWLN